MTNNIIKMKEFECSCCGEKFVIKVNESGEITVTPFILPKEEISSAGIYNFGEKGGENY